MTGAVKRGRCGSCADKAAGAAAENQTDAEAGFTPAARADPAEQGTLKQHPHTSVTALSIRAGTQFRTPRLGRFGPQRPANTPAQSR